MKRIKINLKKVENQTVNLIASYFKKGKVVVYPTDTLYGLGCLATCQPAISKIYKLKGIKSPKPLIVLIKDFKMLHAFCQVNKTQEKYIRCFWPSTAGKKEEKKKLPTTFILRSRGRLPKEILGQGNSLAVRLPKNDFLTKILVQVQAPIISTSVNITGQSPVRNVKNIASYFKGLKPDLVVDNGEIKNRQPSTIIDIRNIKPDFSGIKVIR